MNFQDKHLLRKRNFYILIYTISSAALIMCGISYFIVAAVSNNTKFMVVSSLFILAIILFFGGYIVLQIKKGYGKEPIDPYSLEFRYNDISGFVNDLQKKVDLVKIGNNIYAAKLVHRKKIYHILAYSFDTFSLDAFKKIEKQTMHKCILQNVFPRKLSRYDLQNTVRINFIFLNDNCISSNNFCYNSCKSLQVSEGIVNCYITSGGIQLPALWGGFSIHSKKYNSAIQLIYEI